MGLKNKIKKLGQRQHCKIHLIRFGTEGVKTVIFIKRHILHFITHQGNKKTFFTGINKFILLHRGLKLRKLRKYKYITSYTSITYLLKYNTKKTIGKIQKTTEKQKRRLVKHKMEKDERNLFGSL